MSGRGKKTPAQTGHRANINIGGLGSAMGGGGDSFTSNAAAGPEDMEMYSPQYEQALGGTPFFKDSNGNLTRNPVQSNVGFWGRLIGRPDPAAQINTNYAQTQALMPLQNQQFQTQNDITRKGNIAEYGELTPLAIQRQQGLGKVQSQQELETELLRNPILKARLQDASNIDVDQYGRKKAMDVNYIPQLGQANNIVELNRQRGLNDLNIEYIPRLGLANTKVEVDRTGQLNGLAQDNAFNMFYNQQGMRTTPDAQASVNSAFLARNAAGLSKSLADEASNNVERDRINLTKDPSLNASAINAFNDVEKAKLGFNKTGLDAETLQDPNYQLALKQGQIASAAMPIAALNKASTLNLPQGDTLLTPQSLNYGLPTEHPGMIFKGATHQQGPGPAIQIPDPKTGKIMSYPSQHLMTTPIQASGQHYIEEEGQLYIPRPKAQTTNTTNTPSVKVIPPYTQSGKIDPQVAALLMRWLQQTNR